MKDMKEKSMKHSALPSVIANGIRDPRVRRYIAPLRIVSATGDIREAERLTGSCEIQSYAHRGMSVCRMAPGAEIILDFGCELPGGIRIVTAPNETFMSKVRLTFGESVSEALGTPNNDHAVHQTELLLPPTGMTEYGNTGFRFIRLEVPEDAERPLELISVFAVALFRDLEYAGWFHSSDERLNRIWKTGAYTVHANMQDYLYDGIKRDRMVWLGDAYPETRTILAVFNDTECVENTLDFSISHTPRGAWLNETSSYAAWWVICQFEWFWRRGRFEYLLRQHSALRDILHQLAACIDENGNERLPETRFLDWPSRNDPAATHAGLQGLLAWCFKCGQILAVFLQDEALAELCALTRKKLLLAPVPQTENKSAAAMLTLGNVPVDWTRQVLQDKPERGISTFYGYFVLEARARYGDLTGALHLIRRYWGSMMDYGATTFWEDFDLDWTQNASGIDELPQADRHDLHADFGKYCYQGLRHSLCHGWAGGPAAFLSEHLLGVRPLAPGFRRIEISPQFSGLEELSGSVPTPYGPVRIEGTPDDWRWEAPDGIEVVTVSGIAERRNSRIRGKGGSVPNHI